MPRGVPGSGPKAASKAAGAAANPQPPAQSRAKAVKPAKTTLSKTEWVRLNEFALTASTVTEMGLMPGSHVVCDVQGVEIAFLLNEDGDWMVRFHNS